MNTTSFEAFERDAWAAGFNEVTHRDWQPETEVPEHTHPFDAQAVVVHGAMWLSCGGDTRHIAPGGAFTLPKGTPHLERHGIEGASY